MNEEYILIDIAEQPSKNGVTMWRLTFQRISDNLIVEMTVDNTYRNFRKSGWDHVVSDDNPWGVYGDLKLTDRRTRQGVPVVTADSPARIIYRCESHQQALDLAEASVDYNSPAQRLGKFVSFE